MIYDSFVSTPFPPIISKGRKIQIRKGKGKEGRGRGRKGGREGGREGGRKEGW